MSTKRITYFDALKGFAIILVVFCHHVVLDNDTIVGNVFMSFAWAAVPCFFMVTGGLLHNTRQFTWKKWWERILKVYSTLCVWKLLYLCFYAIFSEITVDFVGVVKYLFLMGSIGNVDTGPMWFIYAYLQALIIFPITYRLYYDEKDKRSLMYLLGLMWISSVFTTVINSIGIDIGNSLLGMVPFSGYKNMLFYFMLGIFLLVHKDTVSQFLERKNYGKYVSIIMVVFGIIGAMLIKYSYTGSFRWNGIYLDNGYNRLSTMIMAIGLYLVFSLDVLPDKVNQALSKLGQHTMGVFYLHYPVMIVLKKLCYKFIENYGDYYSFGLNVIQTIVVVSICLGITVIAKKIPVIRQIFN